MKKTVVYKAIRVWTCFLSIIRFIEGKTISNWNSDLPYKGASVELVVLSRAVFFFSMCHMMSLCCHVWYMCFALFNVQ